MVAQVLPYIGPFRFALEVAKSGRYGKPIGGHFKRIISNPSWIPDFYVRDRVGGPMVDLHVHDTHFISLVFGMPKAVTAVGRVHGSVAKFAHALFHFDDASLAVAASTGVIDQDGRPFTHGFELTLERATIHFEFAALADHAETMDLKVLTPDGRVERPSLAASDDVSAFVDEIADMAASVTGGIARPNLAGDTARDAIHLTHAVQDSVLQNRTIMV
jgi:predicted dehydrogenase